MGLILNENSEPEPLLSRLQDLPVILHNIARMFSLIEKSEENLILGYFPHPAP